jgi:hypothetical protein
MLVDLNENEWILGLPLKRSFMSNNGFGVFASNFGHIVKVNTISNGPI